MGRLDQDQLKKSRTEMVSLFLLCKTIKTMLYDLFYVSRVWKCFSRAIRKQIVQDFNQHKN